MQDDVDGDDDVDEDEMIILVPSMPDQRNGIRKQDEMIRQGQGFSPLLRQTLRNDEARNEMKDERRMSAFAAAHDGARRRQGRYVT